MNNPSTRTLGSNSPTSECGTDNCNTSVESSSNLSINLATNLSLTQGFLSAQGGVPSSTPSSLRPSPSSSSSSSLPLPASIIPSAFSPFSPPPSTISSASSSEKSHNVAHHRHLEPPQPPQGLPTQSFHNVNAQHNANAPLTLGVAANVPPTTGTTSSAIFPNHNHNHNFNNGSWPLSLGFGRERQPSNASIGSSSRYSESNDDRSVAESTHGGSPSDG